MAGAMTVLIGLATGVLAARLLWMAAGGLFAGPAFERRNFRDRAVPTGVGVLLALAVLVVDGGRSVAAAAGIGPDDGPGTARVAVLFAVLGFAALGLLDDVAGSEGERGWRSHLGALSRGRLSAGGVKLLGGGALALVLASATGPDSSPARLAADAALVALAANLANGFDTGPGRMVKAGLLAWVPLALVAGTGPVGVALAPVMGAAVGLLPEDLGERLMLGDAGANALGAALGIGVVLELGPGARTATVIVLAVLNVAAEMISFSGVIQATPGLRHLDRFGRLP
jgi:UDP-N-acetylmuramyl pentapeptide phosphotransferase/UDP-N-acetylglucosamine-1-phosphate transferase